MTVFVRLLSLAGSCLENETQGFVNPRCLTMLKKVATFIWFVNFAVDVVQKIEMCLCKIQRRMRQALLVSVVESKLSLACVTYELYLHQSS